MYASNIVKGIIKEIGNEVSLLENGKKIMYPSVKDKMVFLEHLVAIKDATPKDIKTKIRNIIDKFARRSLKLKYNQITNIYLYAPLWLTFYEDAVDKTQPYSRLQPGYIPSWYNIFRSTRKGGRKTRRNKKRKTRKY
jgi:hypothetical protein